MFDFMAGSRVYAIALNRQLLSSSTSYNEVRGVRTERNKKKWRGLRSRGCARTRTTKNPWSRIRMPSTLWVGLGGTADLGGALYEESTVESPPNDAVTVDLAPDCGTTGADPNPNEPEFTGANDLFAGVEEDEVESGFGTVAGDAVVGPP